MPVQLLPPGLEPRLRPRRRVYTGVSCARRLVDERSWSFPLLCGMLFFGICGIYECQGPLMGWWLWPRPDGIVKAGCNIWQAWELGEDARGLVVSPHAAEALAERVHGVPVMAPYFHFAFGFGWAASLLLTGPISAESPPSMRRFLIAGVLVLVLFLPPIWLTRGLTEAAGFPLTQGVPLSLALSTIPSNSLIILSWSSLCVSSGLSPFGESDP